METEPDEQPQELQYRSVYEPPHVDDLSRMYRDFFTTGLTQLGLGCLIVVSLFMVVVTALAMFFGML